MRDLLFELGSEELPAGFVVPALDQLERLFRESCISQGIEHGSVCRFGTPRRLALLVRDVAANTPEISRTVQGPSLTAAFDADGTPKIPALKFAEAHRVPIERLERITTPRGTYLSVTIEEPGQSTISLLPAILTSCLRGLVFPKSMRWSDVKAVYARPLHWIVALFGEEILPVIFADVQSGRNTYGHRFLDPKQIVLCSATEYEATLEKAHVIPNIQKRRQLLVERISEAAREAGCELRSDDELIDQVVNLVELPSPVTGTFDARHLELPPEILIQEMKVHQRYFPLYDQNGALAPKFIAVSNTPVRNRNLSIRGYERVLRARLTDGRFFFDEDRRLPLTEWITRLQRRTWVAALGTMAEKSDRIRMLGGWLAESVGQSECRSAVERAASLCKADLETGMVGEFPELQGVMGREYALHSGESAEVALAVFEHYLPRSAGDTLPTQDPGALVGLADRLDSLCGLFAIGKKPHGNKDDFALRRAAISFIRIVIDRSYRFSLATAIDHSMALLEPKLSDNAKRPLPAAVKESLLEFFRGRLESLWREDNRPDVVDAVLSAGCDDLVSASLRLRALAAEVQRPDFALVIETFKRVANIVAKQAGDVAPAPVNPTLLTDREEKALHLEITKLKVDIHNALLADDFATALNTAASLREPVDAFFNGVLVMAEDQNVRGNRVRLLMETRELFSSIADFSKLHSPGTTPASTSR